MKVVDQEGIPNYNVHKHPWWVLHRVWLISVSEELTVTGFVIYPIFNIPGERLWGSQWYPQPLQSLLVSHDLRIGTERTRRRLQSDEMSLFCKVAGLGDGEELRGEPRTGWRD